MHQNRIASLRAVATIALPCPRRARVRSENACSGPGCKTTLQAASTSAQRAAAEPRLLIRPLRAVGDPRRFLASRKLVGYLGLDPKVRQSGDAPAAAIK